MKTILALTLFCLVLAIALIQLSIQLGSVGFFVCGIISVKACLMILVLMAYERKMKKRF